MTKIEVAAAVERRSFRATIRIAVQQRVAFKVTKAEYESRLRIEGEGRSVNFHDHDKHLFELHIDKLAERLEWPAAGFVDTESWSFMKLEVVYAAKTVWA